MLAAVLISSIVLLALAYRFYGRFLERQFGIDPSRTTPASGPDADGVDLHPARTPVLFGHHFSSIAGAGPIVGPIIAAQWFGWGPALAWVLVGAILVGGVHDFGSLALSIRHKARSIAEVCRMYLSPLTYRAFLLFIFLTLVYVLVVFVDLTAAGFLASTAESPDQGGIVATASLAIIGAAVAMGFVLRRASVSNGALVAMALGVVAASLALAHGMPLTADRLPSGLPPQAFWVAVLLAYCLAASVAPVWLLLQPRDFIASFFLYICLAAGALGMLAASLAGTAPVRAPAFTGWTAPDGYWLFPVLFITIACGACSGFHSVIASGTTARQLASEAGVKPIAYGGMLVEALLAVVALGTLMAAGSAGAPPTVAFADGMGRFFGVFGAPHSFGAAFGLLAISCFLLTTLDTVTRLGRFLFEEFFGVRGPKWRWTATIACLAPAGVLAMVPFAGPDGAPIAAWRILWPAFGTMNQVIGALALLVILVWRRAEGKSTWFVAWPMAFMLATTTASMVQLGWRHLLQPGGSLAVGGVAALLLVLTAVVAGDTARRWSRIGRGAPAGA